MAEEMELGEKLDVNVKQREDYQLPGLGDQMSRRAAGVERGIL